MCFPLSEPEAKRLRRHVGSDLKLGEQPNSEVFVEVMTNLFPGESRTVNKIFPSGKTHLTLGINQDGFCVHLGKQGCTLPREVRPWFCKIFPFWIMEGNLTGFDAPCCLAARQTISIYGVLRKMGQSESRVLEIYNRLRSDWGFVPHIPGIVADK
ncbi:MAG: zinc/iron-chelating domain-containing protein [Desulfovibrionaceae bacterium]|nr:zinc/iron-chelating domain-containing protein [Desulfovibrionaceae bacterium]